MLIEIPKELHIGSHTYKVIFDEREDDGDFSGSSIHRHHEILLNPDAHIQQLRITYLHEILHVINRTFALYPEEQTVERLAEGLGELLFNNLKIELDFSKIPIRKVR